MALEKAIIEILDHEAVGGARNLPARIEVQFNPTEYSINKGAQIAEIGVYGIDSPILQFIRGQNEKLSLDLFFDTTRPDVGEIQSSMGSDAVDVRKKTNQIYQLVKMQPKLHAPPKIRFYWGSLSFHAIVESVQQKFTLFSPNGVPLRATLSVVFREYKTLEQQLRELNLMSSDHTRQRIIKDGDTLSSIAAEEYRDPGMWKVIAELEENRDAIKNPRKLVAGATLFLPALDASGRNIGEKP